MCKVVDGRAARVEAHLREWPWLLRFCMFVCLCSGGGGGGGGDGGRIDRVVVRRCGGGEVGRQEGAEAGRRGGGFTCICRLPPASKSHRPSTTVPRHRGCGTSGGAIGEPSVGFRRYDTRQTRHGCSSKTKSGTKVKLKLKFSDRHPYRPLWYPLVPVRLSPLRLATLTGPVRQTHRGPWR